MFTKPLSTDRVSGILVALLGGMVSVGAFLMPTFAQRGINEWTVPGIFPGFVGTVLVICGVLLALRRPENAPQQQTQAPTNKAEFTKALLLTFIYIILLGRIPFVPLTIAFFASFMIVFELDSFRNITAGPWRLLGLIAFVLVASIGIPWVFQTAFLVTLP